MAAPLALGEIDEELLLLIYENCAGCILRDKAVCRRFLAILPSLERFKAPDVLSLARPCGKGDGEGGGEKGEGEQEHEGWRRDTNSEGGHGGRRRDTWGSPLHIMLGSIGPSSCLDACTLWRRVVGLDLRELKYHGESFKERVHSRGEDGEEEEGGGDDISGPRKVQGDSLLDSGFPGSLSSLVRACTPLQLLLLPRGVFSQENFDSLAASLGTANSLTCLSLEGNRIGSLGATLLAKGLSHNSTLTSLSLGFCGIGADGLDALSDVFAANTGLRHLNLDTNGLCEQGAQRLGGHLSNTTSLVSLDLGCNFMRSAGLASLSGVIAANTRLTSLGIGCNDIGAEGVRLLDAALSRSSSITHLDLSKNDLGLEGANALVPILCTKGKLATLSVGSNGISSSCVVTIRQALVSNCVVDNCY